MQEKGHRQTRGNHNGNMTPYIMTPYISKRHTTKDHKLQKPVQRKWATQMENQQEPRIAPSIYFLYTKLLLQKITGAVDIFTYIIN